MIDGSELYLGFTLHLPQEILDAIENKCEEIGKSLDDVYKEFSTHFQMQKFLLPNDYRR